METGGGAPQHRFIAVGGVLCRTEAGDGSFAPEAVFGSIGALQVPLAVPEVVDHIAVRRGRPPKRTRSDPSLAWSGGTHSTLAQEVSAVRCGLLANGSGDSLVTSYFETPCTSMLVDYSRRTSVAAADVRAVQPRLRSVQPKQRVDGGDAAPWQPKDESNSGGSSKQLKHYFRFDVHKVRIEGWLDVCATNDGTTYATASDDADEADGRGDAVHRALVGLPGKPLSGRQFLADEACSDLVGCMHEFRTICQRPIDSAAACAMLLRETKSAEAQAGHNVDLRCLSVDVPDAIARCRALGSFACLLPAREGSMHMLPVPRKYRRAALAGKGVRALTDHYFADRRASVVNAHHARTASWNTSVASIDFVSFWHHIHVLGIGKRSRKATTDAGPTPMKQCRSVAAQVRQLSAEYTFFLYGKDECCAAPPLPSDATLGASPSALSYADAVAAYNQLVANPQTRRVLVGRLAALVAGQTQAADQPPAAALRGSATLPLMHSSDQLRRELSAMSVMSIRSSTTHPDGTHANETTQQQPGTAPPLEPFLDAQSNSRAFASLLGKSKAFQIDPAAPIDVVQSVHPGEQIHGWVVDKWMGVMEHCGKAIACLAAPAPGACRVKALSYLTCEWFHKKQQVDAQTYLPHRLLSPADLIACATTGDGLWLPLNVQGKHWVVLSFSARARHADHPATKQVAFAPVLSVYDAMGKHSTFKAQTIAQAERVEQMLKATLRSARAAFASDESVQGSSDPLHSACARMLLSQWRIRFAPEYAMTTTNECGLVAIRRLSCALLGISAESAQKHITRKVVEYVLFAADGTTSAERPRGAAGQAGRSVDACMDRLLAAVPLAQ